MVSLVSIIFMIPCLYGTIIMYGHGLADRLHGRKLPLLPVLLRAAFSSFSISGGKLVDPTPGIEKELKAVQNVQIQARKHLCLCIPDTIFSYTIPAMFGQTTLYRK
uniref:Uncharacterized protein n=1 Tax=Cacopsylla melanoneura TaxID=428564 RepID=A0A8D8SB15_9HEMI